MVVLLAAASWAADPVEVPPIRGEVQLQREGDQALRIVTGPEVTQNLWWGPADGPLADRARHELDLILRAANVSESSFAADRFEPTEVGALPAVALEARVRNTLFQGVAFDCPQARVVLVTCGKPARVRELHREALRGARCRVPAGV